MKKKLKYQSMIGGQKGKSLKEIVGIVTGGNGGADLRPKVPTEGPKVKSRRHGKLGSPKSLGSARNARVPHNILFPLVVSTAKSDNMPSKPAFSSDLLYISTTSLISGSLVSRFG